MTTIAGFNTSTDSTFTPLVAGAAADAEIVGSDAGSASASSSDTPATSVELSARAKALLQRDKIEQVVAQRLAAQLNSAKADTKDSRSPAERKADNDRADDILRKYGDLPQAQSWAAQARTDNVELIKSGFSDADKWVDFARRMNSGEEVYLTPGRIPSDDESFQISVNLSVARQVVAFEDAGQTDKAQSLRAALDTGAISVQRSDTVPGLNFRYQTIHFGDAGGGGTWSGGSLSPTGDVKTALDNGDAIVIGGGDRGAFYISW